MNKRQLILSAARIIEARATGRRIPVAVRWNLLNRCVCSCRYCNLWQTESIELSFDDIAPVLRQLRDLGTTQISYSGGEPLLRDDIGRIVEETARLGIAPTMNSSGYGLKKHINELKSLDLLKISLDGPEEIHDRVRNHRGAFNTAVEAAGIGREHLRAISFGTTITKYNVAYLGYMLELAERFDTTVTFQPLKALYRGVASVEDISPASDDLIVAAQMLIDSKRNGNKRILNSIVELERMKLWPAFPHVDCTAGKIFVMINPDGTLLPCDRISYESKLPNVLDMPVRQALNLLPVASCHGCAFTGSQQLNMLYSLNPKALIEVLRLSK